jgi:hypothetical protein
LLLHEQSSVTITLAHQIAFQNKFPAGRVSWHRRLREALRACPDLQAETKEEASRKIAATKAGNEGTPVADTPSSEVYGWLLEAGGSSDLKKAKEAFSKAAAIIDRLAGATPT